MKVLLYYVFHFVDILSKYYFHGNVFLTTFYFNFIKSHFCLGHGGDPSVIDEHHVTPVHRAVRCSDTRLIRLLGDNGANLSVTDAAGNTPLLSLCHVSGMPCNYSYWLGFNTIKSSKAVKIY